MDNEPQFTTELLGKMAARADQEMASASEGSPDFIRARTIHAMASLLSELRNLAADPNVTDEEFRQELLDTLGQD